MPRRSEEPPDPMEKLAQEVLCLAREILVLRETLDEIREYMQWNTRNTDQFRIVVRAENPPTEDRPEPVPTPEAEPTSSTQGSLFD